VVVYEPRNHSVDAVVRAPSDGYTLLLTHAEDVYNELLYPVRFKYIRDIAPVASIIRTPFVMVVSPSFPATTVPAFIAYAKSNLGKVNMASAGVGSGNHLSGELFKMMAVGHNVKCLN
jgi:tripartite-type tricarboxylate transporter receptor subunit TctC